MKRPLAYLTAAWSGEPDVDMELAAHYCRLAYEAGFSPICPLLYLPLFLNDSVPEEHKAGIDMRRDMLRRSHSHGGTMVANEVAAVLSPAAKKCGFKDKGYICYEEDAQESVVLRELMDKKLWKIPDRIKDKGQFEEKLNQSIRQYHPEYWRARQSGREAAEAARSTAPAKEAAR